MNGNKLPIVYELLKRNTFGLYFILKDFISRNVSLQILRMKVTTQVGMPYSYYDETIAA